MSELMPERMPERMPGQINQAGGGRARIVRIFHRLVEVQAEDEETARLGRLFNILMLVSIFFSLLFFATYLLANRMELFTKSGDVWIKGGFALLFTPLAIFCFIQVTATMHIFFLIIGSFLLPKKKLYKYKRAPKPRW